MDSVISDLMGVSGKAMLRAIMDGATQPEAIASAVCTRLKASPEQLKEALEGQVGPHQRMLLKTLMQHIEHIDGAIATLDTEVEGRLHPFQELIRRIDD